MAYSYAAAAAAAGTTTTASTSSSSTIGVIDSNHPYFLNNSDNPGTPLVSHLLTESNYHQWSRSVSIALSAKLKLGFVDGSISKPVGNHIHLAMWNRCNDMVVSCLSQCSKCTALAQPTTISDFSELPNSGGVKVLDLRIAQGELPVNGDQVAIHYYGRLAAKQGWRFDSTYDHKDETGEPIPFSFILGSDNVISGIQAAVRSMKVGSIRRVVIPPSQGYQNMLQEPLPPNYFDRQRLFTTIFNPTRMANGEGSTLGTLVFDIELVSLRHQ